MLRRIITRTRRAGLLLGALLLLAAFIRVGNVAPLAFTAQWSPLKIGAGGQITAVYNYPDGTILARSDNYGAWIYVTSGSCTYGWVSYAAPCWQNPITPTSIAGYSIDSADSGNQATEFVAAPSNTNVLYLLFNGGLYVSTNRGGSWIKCSNFVGNSVTANSGNAIGPYIAVDPNTPATIIIDTGNAGVYRSTNATSGATATFTQISGVGTTAQHVVAFQPGSSSHIVIWSQGTGAFESTTGPSGTFSAITTGSPPSSTILAPHITADQFNQFWVWDSKNSTSNVYRWASSSWSAIATGATGNGSAAALAIDPIPTLVANNHIAVSGYNGQIVVSSNNGSTWSTQQTNETVSCGASQPPWLCTANQGVAPSLQLNGYSMAFDNSSNLFYAGGLGLWQTSAPVSGNLTVWNANSLGIEQLVGNETISPPGGWPIMGVWDKGFFTLKNPDVFPSTQWNNDTSKNGIIGGWALDYASADPTFITGFATSNISASVAPASSTDGGNTWTQWAATPTQLNIQYGAMAALDSTHWIVSPGNEPIQFTANGGASWANSTISGTPTNWSQGPGLPLAADRVAANTFCAARGGGASFYFSTNAGSSFTTSGLTNGGGAGQVDGNPGAFSFKSVPGQSGNFFYTAGEQVGSAGAHPANTHLWKITKTTNPCDTATSVSANLKEVMSFGFGAPPPTGGSGYPTIYANGWFSGVQGYYQSVDGGTTWTAINVPSSQQPWALNQADFPPDLTGDMDVYGRIYQTFAQSGGAYIDTADACPWVKFSNTNPHASLTGTVTLSAQHSGLVPVVAVDFYVDGVLIGRQTSGTGTPTTYSQSWVTGGVATGAHTLKVLAEGSTNPACTTSLTVGNSQSIPITTH